MFNSNPFSANWVTKDILDSIEAILQNNLEGKKSIGTRAKVGHQSELETLQKLVVQKNWDGVATFIEKNSKLPVKVFLQLEDTNLDSKTFMTQLLVHVFKRLTTNLTHSHQMESIKCQELNKQQKTLQSEVDQLTRKLLDLKPKLETVEVEVKDSSKKVEVLSGDLQAVKSTLTEVEQLYNENNAALKQWQARLQDVKHWTSDDVTQLLTEIGMKDKVKSLQDHRLDGNVLFDLTTADMMKMGLTFVESKRMQKALYLLKHYNDIYITPPGILQWSNETVCMWLEDNKFSHLVPKFKQLQITGSELAFLDRKDLNEQLKIEAFGDCIRLEKAFKEMFQNDTQEQISKVSNLAESFNAEALVVKKVCPPEHFNNLFPF